MLLLSMNIAVLVTVLCIRCIALGCPRYSQDKTCTSACPKTCRNMYMDEKPCTLPCVSACECDDGFVINDRAECVRPADCLAEEINCPNNLVYQKCGGCEKTFQVVPKTCKCQMGCFCDNLKYYDNKTRSCKFVEEECPDSLPNQECQTQDPNSEYRFCDYCTPTCFNHNPICTYECKDGCRCQKGYVQDPSGKCVHPSQCP